MTRWSRLQHASWLCETPGPLRMVGCRGYSSIGRSRRLASESPRDARATRIDRRPLASRRLAIDTFQAENPATGEPLPEVYPVSGWDDCDAALTAAAKAARSLRRVPPERLAALLERLAERIERRAGELVETAHAETGLPKQPRLADVELPRTTNQLRQAAAAAREGSWMLPTIDTKLNIRSCLEPLGPVCVFGPEQLSVRLQQRRGRRLCGGDRGRQPGDRQGQHFAPGHHAAAGRRGLAGGGSKPTCRRRPCN